MHKDLIDQVLAGEDVSELIVGVQTPTTKRKRASKSTSNQTKEVPGRPGSGPNSQTEDDVVTEGLNLKVATKHLKDSILRYKGMKIDSKVADELSRHIASVLPELVRIVS